MKLIKVKTGDAMSKEECLREIDKALISMRPGMDKISKTIKQLRAADKNAANEKQTVFNKLVAMYYELGQNL